MNRKTYLILVAVIFVAFPALAGDSDQGLGVCGDYQAPAEKRIEACTALIQTGTLSPEKKAEVLKRRAGAYIAAAVFDNRNSNKFNALAIKDYDEVIRMKPDDWLTIYNRGSAYHGLGQYAQAINDYDETIRLKPDYALAYVNRGMVKRQSGDAAGANADLAKACAIDSSAIWCK